MNVASYNCLNFCYILESRPIFAKVTAFQSWKTNKQMTGPFGDNQPTPNESVRFGFAIWYVDFLEVLYFFSWLVMPFKGLVIPVWREIHRSKILPVTSWQLTNRTVSDISRHSRHNIMSIISLPARIYSGALARSWAPWVRKFGYQCIQEILVLIKSFRTSTPLRKAGWNFAVQVPVRFGGKSHNHPDF